MAKGFKIELDSKAIERQLELALRRNPQKTAQKVTQIALDLQAKSAKLAPIETGDLKSNCHADLSKVKGSKSQATVGYSLPYALRQHEELGYNHPKGGQAKFLEQPFLENEQHYADMLRAIPGEIIDEVSGKRRSSKIPKRGKK